jgi:hypothetical protein
MIISPNRSGHTEHKLKVIFFLLKHVRRKVSRKKHFVQKVELKHPMTVYIPIYKPIYIHTYLHSYLHTYRLTLLYTYIHNYIHTYLHTFIHTDLHEYSTKFSSGKPPLTRKVMKNKQNSKKILLFRRVFY